MQTITYSHQMQYATVRPTRWNFGLGGQLADSPPDTST
jgi:hypothetical protein